MLRGPKPRGSVPGQLLAALPGSYDNLAQSRAEPRPSRRCRLMIAPVQAPLVGDHVFYVQEMAADDARRVLAQRLYVRERRARRRDGGAHAGGFRSNRCAGATAT